MLKSLPIISMLSLLLIGCGGSGSEDSAAKQTPRQQTPIPAPAPIPEPVPAPIPIPPVLTHVCVNDIDSVVLSEQEIYVNSNTGRDTHSGQNAAPLATLSGAQCLVRKLILNNASGIIRVNIASGDYRLDETLVLGLQDSGDDDLHIVYEGQDADNPPVFHSDITLTGWRKSDETLFKTEHPSIGGSAAQYFENDQFPADMYEADLPEGLERILTLYQQGEELEIATSAPFASQIPITPPGSPSLFHREYRQHLFVADDIMDVLVKEKDLGRLDQLELDVFYRQKWMHAIARIKDIAKGYFSTTVKMGRIGSSGPETAFIEGDNPILLDRFMPAGLTDSVIRKGRGIKLMNSFRFLTSGQWVVDTSNRKIYIRTLDGRAPQGITTPKLNEYIKVEGDVVTDVSEVGVERGGPEVVYNARVSELENQLATVDTLVNNIHFKNMLFTRAARDYQQWNVTDDGDDSNDYYDSTTHSEFAIYDKDNAVIRFRGAKNSSVDNIDIINSGANGIRLDLSSQNIKLINNRIHNMGKTGIVVLGYGPGRKKVNNNNLIQNNHIANTGLHHKMGQGIVLSQTNNTKVLNNKIEGVTFNGISVVGLRYGVVPEQPYNQRLGQEGAAKFYKTSEYHAIRLGELDTDIREGVRSGEEIVRQFRYLSLIDTNNIEIAYNEISNVTTVLGDSNAIYVNTSRENIYLHHNYIHHITNDQGSAALRADNQQKRARITHNILYELRNEGAIDYYEDVEILNNYIINIQGQSNPAGRFAFKLQTGGARGYSRIENNIVYDTRNPDRDSITNYILPGAPGHKFLNLIEMNKRLFTHSSKNNLYFSLAGKNKQTGEYWNTADFLHHIKNSIITESLLDIPASYNWNVLTLRGRYREQGVTESDQDYQVFKASLDNRLDTVLGYGNIEEWAADQATKTSWSEYDRGLFSVDDGDQFTDPLFLDASFQTGFGLQDASPARQDNCFEALDVGQMGLMANKVELSTSFELIATGNVGETPHCIRN